MKEGGSGWGYWIIFEESDLKGMTMTPEERLKACEEKIVEQGLAKLEKMVAAGEEGKFLKKCQIYHTEEQVKLAHRIRSIIAKGPVQA